MIKGEHNTRVWLNGYDVVIFRHGMFFLLTSTLEGSWNARWEMKAKNMTQISHYSQIPHGQATATLLCWEGWIHTVRQMIWSLPKHHSLRWIVGPPPLPLLTALILTEAQVPWESIPMGIPFPGIYIWLSPLKPFHRRQRTEPLHRSWFKSLENDFVGITEGHKRSVFEGLF